MIDDEVAGSSRTLSSMARHIRHVCIRAIKRHRINNGHRLGGDREFVVIDESCLRHQQKVGKLSDRFVRINADLNVSSKHGNLYHK